MEKIVTISFILDFLFLIPIFSIMIYNRFFGNNFDLSSNRKRGKNWKNWKFAWLKKQGNRNVNAIRRIPDILWQLQNNSIYEECEQFGMAVNQSHYTPLNHENCDDRTNWRFMLSWDVFLNRSI